MASKEFCGDDLISVFESLEIDLGSLHQNVIRGWFDTDCEDMKKMLSWMCKSLGKENILDKQENIEYVNLCDEENNSNLNNIEYDYPGIFDVEKNEFYINLFNEEIDICSEELRDLNNILFLNRNINRNLITELSELRENELKKKDEYKVALLKCENLSKNLDDLNIKLYHEMTRYGKYLYDFEYSIPRFINNMDINKFQDNIGNVWTDMEAIKNKFEDIDGSNLVNPELDNIYKRILHSLHNHLEVKCKEQPLLSTLNFLNSYSLDSYVSIQRSHLKSNILSKIEQFSALLERNKLILADLTEIYVSQPKLSYALNELETQTLNLQYITKILDLIKTLHAVFIIICVFFKTEHKDIQNTESFFVNICKYISSDLQPCIFRTEAMENNNDELNIYNSGSVFNKISISREISKLLNEKKNESLNAIIEVLTMLKFETKVTENKLFSINFNSIQDDLESDIHTLWTFLTPGPTSRVSTIPLVLNAMSSHLQEALENQDNSLKTVCLIMKNISKSENPQEKLKRTSWMYTIFDSSRPALYEASGYDITTCTSNLTYM